MADVQDYLLTIDSDKEAASHIAEETAKNLQAKSKSLIDVVQSLGEYINDESPSIRNKASSYLTAVINALPEKFLSRQQILVLCQFYCDRVEDGDGMAGLEGLSGLMGMGRFGGSEMVGMAARAVFANFQDLQVRAQGQRYEILQAVNLLMESHRKGLKEMGDEALIGIVDLVSGEKDPRNLMLVFSMLRVIMVEWDISNHTEPLFDAVFCYFPIAFRPPPNDPYGITAQDLKIRLRDCIAARSEFAPYSFPALLDKLDSSSLTAKKDVLQAIKACSLSYDPNTMSRYSITLWDSLKYEILNAQEEDLEEEALTALRAIAERLSEKSSTAPTSLLAQYLRPVLKECNEQLQEPQQKQAKPAGRIISSLGQASTSAYALVIKAVLAPLLTIYQDTDGHAKQRSLLEVMVALFDSAIEVFGSRHPPALAQTAENPLDSFRDKLQELLSQALMSTNKAEVSFRLIALKGLLRLASIQGFLHENEIGLIVQYLDEIVLVEESYGRDELKQEAIRGLAEISKSNPRLISDITFPTFMATLPNSDSQQSQYLTTLEGLAQISVEKALFDTLIRRLLNKLDVVLTGDSSPAYPRAILSTILYVFEREGIERDPNLGTYYQRIVIDLFRRAALPLTKIVDLTSLHDDSVLEVLGSLASLIVQSLPREQQIEVSNNVYRLFLPEEGQYVVRQLDKPQFQTMILSTYLLAAIPRDIHPPEFFTSNANLGSALFFTLVDLSTNHHDDLPAATILSIHRQIALLVNKFAYDPKLSANEANLAKDSIQGLYSILDEVTPSHSETSHLLPKIRLIFHLSRALLSRLIPQTTKLLPRLLDMVCHSTAGISTPSAHGFALIFAPDAVLISKHGFITRKLFKQKVFMTLVPEISKRFRQATSPLEKSNLLIALSGLLAHTPQAVVLPELPTLLPLLLQSLDLEIEDPSHAVKNATLETLILVVRETPTAIDESGHTTSLVNRLLKTSSFSPPSSYISASKNSSKTDAASPSPPHTRLLALQLLGLFPAHLKQPSLLPLKGKVLRQLSLCADDPKRTVRKESVDCRAKWFSMDEPDAEDD